jgi:hypothetical protein
MQSDLRFNVPVHLAGVYITQHTFATYTIGKGYR